MSNTIKYVTLKIKYTFKLRIFKFNPQDRNSAFMHYRISDVYSLLLFLLGFRSHIECKLLHFEWMLHGQHDHFTS